MVSPILCRNDKSKILAPFMAGTHAVNWSESLWGIVCLLKIRLSPLIASSSLYLMRWGLALRNVIWLIYPKEGWGSVSSIRSPHGSAKVHLSHFSLTICPLAFAVLKILVNYPSLMGYISFLVWWALKYKTYIVWKLL